MSADQLKLLAYLEARNCAFLDIDTPSVQRKDQLTELAQRCVHSPLIKTP